MIKLFKISPESSIFSWFYLISIVLSNVLQPFFFNQSDPVRSNATVFRCIWHLLPTYSTFWRFCPPKPIKLNFKTIFTKSYYRRCWVVFARNLVSETLFQNRIYLVFATVIRIPDVNFTIEKKHFTYFDTSRCTRAAKFDTRFDTPQVLVHMRSCIKICIKIFDTDAICIKICTFFWYILQYVSFFLIHEIVHGWKYPIKTMHKTIHQVIHGR